MAAATAMSSADEIMWPDRVPRNNGLPNQRNDSVGSMTTISFKRGRDGFGFTLADPEQIDCCPTSDLGPPALCIESLDPSSDIAQYGQIRLYDKIVKVGAQDVTGASLDEVLRLLDQQGPVATATIWRPKYHLSSVGLSNGLASLLNNNNNGSSTSNGGVGGSSNSLLGKTAAYEDSQFGQTFFVLLRRQGGSFGLEITLSDQGYIVVVSLHKGGAAAACGRIEPQDVIMAVNHNSVVGVSFNEFAEILSSCGDEALVTLSRPKSLAEKPLQIVSGRAIGEPAAHEVPLTPPWHSMAISPAKPTTIAAPVMLPEMVEVTLRREAGTPLGITVAGVEAAEDPLLVGQSGVVVTAINPQGCAARNNRLKVGDQILSINGRSLINESSNMMKSILREQSAVVFIVAARLREHRQRNSGSSPGRPEATLPEQSSNVPSFIPMRKLPTAPSRLVVTENNSNGAGAAGTGSASLSPQQQQSQPQQSPQQSIMSPPHLLRSSSNSTPTQQSGGAATANRSRSSTMTQTLLWTTLFADRRILALTIAKSEEQSLGLLVDPGYVGTAPPKTFVTVRQVERGSPADQAGVRKGDAIVMVDSTSLVPLTYGEAMQVLARKARMQVLLVARPTVQAAQAQRLFSVSLQASAGLGPKYALRFKQLNGVAGMYIETTTKQEAAADEDLLRDGDRVFFFNRVFLENAESLDAQAQQEFRQSTDAVVVLMRPLSDSQQQQQQQQQQERPSSHVSSGSAGTSPTGRQSTSPAAVAAVSAPAGAGVNASASFVSTSAASPPPIVQVSDVAPVVVAFTEESEAGDDNAATGGRLASLGSGMHAGSDGGAASGDAKRHSWPRQLAHSPGGNNRLSFAPASGSARTATPPQNHGLSHSVPGSGSYESGSHLQPSSILSQSRVPSAEWQFEREELEPQPQQQ